MGIVKASLTCIGFLIAVIAVLVGLIIFFEQESRHGIPQGVSVPKEWKIVDAVSKSMFKLLALAPSRVSNFVDWITWVAPSPRTYDNVSVVDMIDYHELPPTRIFAPLQTASIFPLIIYMHGGGFVVGSAFSAPSSDLAEHFAAHGFIVISIEYTKAPTVKFPVPIEQCDKVMLWLQEMANSEKVLPILKHCNFSDVTVMGDSAGKITPQPKFTFSGGNIAAALAIMDRNRAITTETTPFITRQVLMYPGFHGVESCSQFANGYLLTTELRQWMESQYFTDTEREFQSPLANPMLAPFGHSGFPSAYFIEAEYDHIKTHSTAYAEVLRKAGVSVIEHMYPAPHGFITLGLPESKAAMADLLQDCTFWNTCIH